ncbi:hypothetical protein FVEG_14711 [Fusarium verticillioides 7600]|uniref:Uncharacterized protein n=1 Tax=Gibberella moniliformis (strain M3125 / FGSC 7600) TaxID=334819 RepID=W7LW25_GIBM7|nr:hypothetical protein FVEG_14711 [Fusarium verticillioides 7600]EWG36757.1 hypothetical protein FVEG_14711 [Fusarium verticillioides 7600]
MDNSISDSSLFIMQFHDKTVVSNSLRPSSVVVASIYWPTTMLLFRLKVTKLLLVANKASIMKLVTYLISLKVGNLVFTFVRRGSQALKAKRLQLTHPKRQKLMTYAIKGIAPDK